MKRRAFTLIEMLVATVLAGLLMGGVLMMTTTIARDRARVTADESLPRGAGLVDQLRWDLTNATTMAQTDNGRALILTGHGALDSKSLASNGRLVRVIYEVRGKGQDAALFRTQAYLDDPIRPDPFTELVALNIQSLIVMPESPDANPVEKEKPISIVPVEEPITPPRRRAPQAYYIPTRAKLTIQRTNTGIEEKLWLR